MFKMLKIIIVLGILLAVAGGVGLYFTVNKLVKDGVEKVASDTLKVPVTVREVKLSPFSGTGSIKGLVIGNPEGYHTEHAFAMDRIYVSLDIKSLFSDRVVIRTLHIEAPSIYYEVGLGNSNIGTIKKNVAGDSEDTEAENAESEGDSKAVQIDDIKVAAGEVAVSAKILQGKAASLTLADFEMKNLDSERAEDVIAEVIDTLIDTVIKAVADEGILPAGAEAVQDAVDTGKVVLETTHKVFGALKGALGGGKDKEE
jgi:uncharacterized protein involved in outer membrane biogenesis